MMENPSAIERYNQVLALERNLLAASKSKGSSDPSVRRLRTSIRDGYEGLILRDLALCEAFGVEQALWRLHYREIEGFRLKIRKLLTVYEQSEGHEQAVGHRKKRKKGSKKEPLLRVLASFRSFLGEASGFFHGLLIKLKLQHRLASSLGTADRFSAEGDGTEDLRRCLVACNRILVYLGDLARYKELYAVMESSERDWSVAANYYKQAAVLWPSSGNPYNQLAVLCTYSANSLTALYLYCRSLAVNVPFETAWDNVALLFDKNKQIITQIAASGKDGSKRFTGDMNLPTNLHGFVIEQDLWSIYKVSRSQGWFLILFIELVRTILVKSSTDELDRALIEVESRHKQFLHETVNDVKTSKLADSLPLSLQMTVVLIFCMHHVHGQHNHSGEYALSSTLSFTLRFSSMMAKVAHKKLQLVFPVTVILMEWLASETKILHTFFAKEGTGQLLSDFCERVISLGATINDNIVNDVQCDAEILQPEQNEAFCGKAQWEDHELLGFMPLASVHLNLDFSSQPPGYGISNWATNSCWRLRCTKAYKKFVNMVGQNGHGCLLKMPGGVQCDTIDPEESNKAPSLNEWIGKTFFPGDLSNDLVHTKSTVVSANLREETISTTNALERDNFSDVIGLRSYNTHRKAGGEVLEEKPSPSSQQVLDQKQAVFDGKTLLKIEKLSSTNALFEKTMSSIISSDIGQGVSNLNCAEEPTGSLVSTIQPMITQQYDSKSAEKVKEAGILFGSEPSHLVPSNTRHLHETKSVKSLLCFDSNLHVKQAGCLEAFAGLRTKHSSCSSMGQRKDSSAYSTQNPFVWRLRHISSDADVHIEPINSKLTVKTACGSDSQKDSD